jgi:DNA-binding PadR family transcriptional regulator
MHTPARHRPITRDLYAILVALAAGPQTGTETQDQINADTTGLYVRSSSLYTALHRLEIMGLATCQHQQYRLIDQGWRTLRIETSTFESLVAQAKHCVVAAGHGRW